MLRVLFVCVLSIVVSACVPTEEEFHKRRQWAIEDADFRQGVLDKCMSRKNPEEDLRDLAHLTKVPLKDAKRVFCGRFMKAIVSGRLKYEDVVAWYRYQRATPTMLDIARGRK
ncbi:hypothetical protein NGR_b21270 (plasmid) [Sinorhizobium fredii NGR234]|uniref:Lipoprotein n=1 Tax=Sinorhizobium fredii (strain NBRC 101917 / NGR234) TaxID=394 RepID=C3KMF7_SINFN|nr:hypothetical protein [Sinorhizobium fredii]ACP23572.1 hypothetical protein NGR_b21270 [Sinorhizobium fredii NGR234]